MLTACVVWTAFNTGLESYECLKSAVWDAQDVPQEKVIGGDKDKPFGAINRPCMFTVSTQESGHVISQYYEFDFWDICWLVYSCFFHSLPLQWWVISENLVLSEVRSGGRGKYVITTFDSPFSTPLHTFVNKQSQNLSVEANRYSLGIHFSLMAWLDLYFVPYIYESNLTHLKVLIRHTGELENWYIR